MGTFLLLVISGYYIGDYPGGGRTMLRPALKRMICSGFSFRGSFSSRIRFRSRRWGFGKCEGPGAGFGGGAKHLWGLEAPPPRQTSTPPTVGSGFGGEANPPVGGPRGDLPTIYIFPATKKYPV